MARLLALTDRLPSDSDWKGALTWRIILALAESQHEVLVLTSGDLEKISLTHPRLTVTRPVTSWNALQMPKLARVLLRFQPQVVHVFAPRSSRLWPSLEAWPYLTTLCKMLPNTHRFSTLFEADDWQTTTSSLAWHKEASQITVFSETLQSSARQALGRPVQLLPLDLGEIPSQREGADSNRVMIPEAVSAWQDPEKGLRRLADFLDRHTELTARIVGGWGDWPHSSRRNGWAILRNVGARVELTDATDFDAFVRELEEGAALWLEPIARDSWKFILSSRLAGHLGKRTILSRPEAATIESGSTANALSRLYSQP